MVFGTLGRECQHSVSVGTRLTLPVPSLLERGPRSRRGRRELRAGETVAAAAEHLRAGRGQPQPVSSRMVWRCQNSGPRRRKQRFAGGTRFLAPRRLSSARLTLEARTVRDVRRSTPLRLDARGRKDASAEPKELFSRGPQMSIRPYGSSRGIAKASWGQNARDRRRGLARPLRMGPQRVRSIPLAR